jgi:hypothetical protein
MRDLARQVDAALADSLPGELRRAIDAALAAGVKPEELLEAARGRAGGRTLLVLRIEAYLGRPQEG